MTKRFIEDDDDSDMIDGILQPGGHFRMPMFLRDGSPNPALSPRQRAIAATRDTATFDAASHRPGHRYPSGTNDSLHQPGYRYGVHDAAMEKVYADSERAMNDAWKSKTLPAGSDPEGTSHEGDNNRRDAQQTKDAVYSEYDLRIQNSWRTSS
jgi:hypothetical protein